MTKKDFLAKREAIKAEMVNLEGEAYDAKMRELNMLQSDFAAEQTRETVNVGFSEQEKNFREFLQAKKDGSKFIFNRETSAVVGTKMSDTTSVTPKHLQAVIDKPVSAIVYDLAGCPIINGATGINDWAYAGSAEVKIQNELTPYGDAQKLDLSGKSATQQLMKAKIIISNQSINNSQIDLEALANRKINDAYRDAINFAAVATAKYGANFYGGFANDSKQTYSYNKDGFTFADAMNMVAKVANKDYSVEGGVFVMGPTDFYALKATPKDAGSGLMIIDDNNRLGGFPVLVSTAINKTTVKGTVSGANIGFGLFKYLPCLQHGAVRMSIDATSATAADVDGVILTCNADWSMTNLFPDAFVLGTKSAV